jgi:RimJ/RimL family protein N-acetyltransferase
MTSPLRTERLELIPATCGILTSELSDRNGLSRLLGADIPAAWPPPLMDETVIREFLRLCTAPGGPLFSAWYWVRDEPTTGGRVLVGNGGILQSDTAPDTVVLGYSVLDEYRNRGYATEAVRRIIMDVFSRPGIQRIIATTYPDPGASVRVLEKNGFTQTDRVSAGSGAEEGTVCYVLEKPRQA